MNDKIGYFFLLSLIITILAVHFAFDLKFKTELIQTGNYDQPVYQKPFYGYMGVPGTAHESDTSQTSSSEGFPNKAKILSFFKVTPTKHSGTEKSLGADFSQVYYSAMALRHGDSQYNPKNRVYADPFERRSNYPPLTNWLYTPLTFFDYHVALTIHNYTSLVIFLILSLVILKKYKLQKFSLMYLVLTLLLYFYTPLGFAHFERGQFDLWSASAFLLIFACFYLEKRAVTASIAAGFFSTLKWSSAPFLGTICLLGCCCSVRKKRWVFLIPLAILFFSALLFYRQVVEYLPSLQMYEFQARPSGISFMYLLPKALAKNVQISSCLLVIMLSVGLFRTTEQRSNLLQYISFPFALTMFIQGMCYGTISYEYRIVSIIGLVPGFLIWLVHVPDLSGSLKVGTAVFFATFILIAFRVFYFFFWDLPTVAAPLMSIFYFVCSFVSLTFTCYLIFYRRRHILSNKV